MKDGQNPLDDKGSAIETASALGNFMSGIKPVLGAVGKTADDIDDDKDDDNPDDDKDINDGLEDDKDKDIDEDKDKDKSKSKDKEEEEDDEDTVIHVVASAFEDYEIEGEFEDDAEGLVAVTKQIVTKAQEKAKQEGKDEALEEIPIIKQIYNHLKDGGSIISFLQGEELTDFSKIEIADEDIETAEKIYRTYLESKGNDEEAIETLVGAAKDSGKIIDKGKAAKTALVDSQKEILDKQVAKEKAEYQSYLQEEKKIEDNVKKMLSTGKVNGLEITAEVASKFEKFAFEKDAKGKTEREKKWENAPLELQVMIDILLMQDFKTVGAKTSTTVTKKPLKFKVKPSTRTVDLNTSSGTNALGKIGIKSARDLFNKS